MFAKPYPAEKLVNLGADGHLSAEDVHFLRRQVFKDGIVSAEELDALFTLGERAPKGAPEWAEFFEEAASDFYLNEEEPHGYFTAAEFQTLRARMTHDGAVASPLELRLMVKLLEAAVECPPEMHAFVADQMKKRYAAGGALASEDVALLRRFIFAKGAAGNISVTRAEAELLFDICDAVRGRGNDASWTEFFVKSISNHLMAYFGYQPLAHEEAKRLHGFVSDHSVNVGRFLERMFAGGLSGFSKSAPPLAAERNASREAEAAIAEKVTPDEADWLADRIGRDGTLHETEQALVKYMRDALGAELPPKLKALVARAA
jgi:hypothetical protein